MSVPDTSDGGRVYIMNKQADGRWAIERNLVAPDSESDSNFGISVDISDGRVLVGAPGDVIRDLTIPRNFGANAGAGKGAAYLFELSSHTFTTGDVSWQSDTIRLGEGHGLRTGDEIVFRSGTYSLYGLTNGQRYFVVYDKTDPERIQLARTLAEATGSGGSVVPAQITPFGSGAIVHTFDKVTKLVSALGVAGDAYGLSVAIDGDRAVVGSPLRDRASNADEGSWLAYGFKDGTWRLESIAEPLLGSDAEAGDHVGFAVAISGDNVVVGAPQLHGRPDTQDTNGAGYAWLRNVSPPLNVTIATLQETAHRWCDGESHYRHSWHHADGAVQLFRH